MIYPTTSQLLRCVSFALDTLVKPDPAGKGALSAATTAAHLIRYAGLRVDREAPMLADDITALRTLLPTLRDYLASLDSGEDDSDALLAQIDAALGGTTPEVRGRDLQSLADETRSLRECLYRTQRLLQGPMRAQHREEAAYQRTRQQIRDYIAAQLLREAELMQPAFENRGPRR